MTIRTISTADLIAAVQAAYASEMLLAQCIHAGKLPAGTMMYYELKTEDGGSCKCAIGTCLTDDEQARLSADNSQHRRIHAITEIVRFEDPVFTSRLQDVHDLWAQTSDPEQLVKIERTFKELAQIPE